jgi:hypothetical protein
MRITSEGCNHKGSREGEKQINPSDSQEKMRRKMLRLETVGDWRKLGILVISAANTGESHQELSDVT